MERIVHAGARVTVLHVVAFIFAIVVQTSLKFSAQRAARNQQKPFVRYSVQAQDRALLVADRVVANVTEWSVPFLSLFWLNLALVSATHSAGDGQHIVTAGWVFAVARVVYVFLCNFGGALGTSGPKPRVFIATAPGYLALLYLLVRLISSLVQQ
ncbi:hypothetical protein FVE85_3545 [Porphyridium purpureum]|uniref:Microsomal glutathione S-transferase 3 n=1 Tax=Porphyridium purpureum TaxID=35688 RepID=A0A5J4YNY0_PORPP|nr:hypothetical protein FVE85_3545 [Porphyridium purpureum]|eukprot:POR0998..scf249_10